MVMMITHTTSFSGSSYCFPCNRTLFLTSPPLEFKIPSHFKNGVWGHRFILLNVKCKSEPGSKSTFQLQSETTHSKVAGSDVLCPTGILTGFPLPLFGMLAYGFVSILGLQLRLGPKRRKFDFEKTHSEMILKNFGLDKIQKTLGSKLCIASLVVLALTTSYNVMQPVPSSLAATEMPCIEAKIIKESSPLALSLARHLHSIGAKLYGAFWCSHCVGQKQMFGREAAELLDYVECFPDGVSEGANMAKVCYDVNLKGFPTWEINGQVLTGEKQFSELARLSGIKLEELSQ